MNLNRLLPLTETTFFILTALLEPGHGYYIMQKVEDLSGGTVRIAAGTMYGAIENLKKQKLIESAPSEDDRRKVYVITELGKELLHLEALRIRRLVKITEQFQL